MYFISRNTRITGIFSDTENTDLIKKTIPINKITTSIFKMNKTVLKGK